MQQHDAISKRLKRDKTKSKLDEVESFVFRTKASATRRRFHV